jgi:hypothetical protein
MLKKQHTENELIREMRNIYRQRLVEAAHGINEVEVHDKQGKIIISPGLKVRHKKSKFEYTVQGINAAAKTVSLLSPETPRVTSKPSGSPEMKMLPDEELMTLMNSKIEIPADLLHASEDGEQSDEILDVSFAEFTKNYEVTE